MSFFNQFPVRTYDADKDGIQDTVTDIFRYVDVDDNRIDSISSYIFYDIEDGERPDIVSQKLYGTPDYYWTFFVINDSLKHGLEDWPMSTQEFNDSMEENFSQFSSVQLRMNTEENQPVEFFDEIDPQGNVSNENKYAKQIIFPSKILQSLNPNVFIPPSDAQAKDSLTNTYNASNNTNGIGDISSVIASSYYAGDAGAALSADKSNQLAGIVLDSNVFIKNIDTDEVAKILNYDVNSSSVVFFRDTVSKIDIDTSGSGYLIPPKVGIATSSTGETATAICELGTNGKIDIVEVTTIGGGYKTVPPVVTLDEGPTSPAIVQPLVNNLGIITQLNIVDQGDGYCKKPILSILNPNSTDEFNAKLLLPPFDLNLTDGSISNWDAGDSQVEYEYDVTAKFFGKKVSVTIDKKFPMVYSLSNPVSFLFHLNTQVDAEQPSPTTPFYKVNDNYYDNYSNYYIVYNPPGRVGWHIMRDDGLSHFYADEGAEGQPLQDIPAWYYGLDNDVYWNQTSDPNGYPYDPYEGAPAPITFTTVAIPKTSFNNSNIRVISLTEGGSVAGSNVPLTIVTAYVKAGYTLVSPGTFGFNIINPEETIYEDIGSEDLLNMFSVGSFLYTPSKTFPIIERGEISSNELRLRIRSSDVTTLAKGVNILSDDDEMTSDDSEDITSGFLSGKIEDNYFDLFYNKKEPIVYLSPDKSNQSSLSARIIDEAWVQSLKAFSLVYYQEETAKQKIENYKPAVPGTVSYLGTRIYTGLSRLVLFPAVYNNGGVVADVDYISELRNRYPEFKALGFVEESGFIANVGGVAKYRTFLTSTTSPAGPLPIGTAEYNSNLTKDGVTNVERWLVRIGPTIEGGNLPYRRQEYTDGIYLFSPNGNKEFEASFDISVPLSGKHTTEYSILFSLETYTYVSGVVGTEVVSSQDIQIEFKTDSMGLAVGVLENVLATPGDFIRRAKFKRIVSERPLGITLTKTKESTFLKFLKWLIETRPELYQDAIKYSTRDNTINSALLNDYLSTKLVFAVDIANSKAGESVSYYKDKNGNIIDQALLTTAPDAERDLIQYKNLAAFGS